MVERAWGQGGAGDWRQRVQQRTQRKRGRAGEEEKEEDKRGEEGEKQGVTPAVRLPLIQRECARQRSLGCSAPPPCALARRASHATSHNHSHTHTQHDQQQE